MAKMKTRSKKLTSVTREIKLERASISIDSKQLYKEIFKKIVPSNATPASTSTGVFKHEGSSWEEGCIFMGWCDSLSKGVLIFTGDNASENLQNFRTLFLNKENENSFLHLNFDSSYVVGIPLEGPMSKLDIQNLFYKLSQVQKVKTPKVSIDKQGDFFIGGKTTGNFIRLSGNFGKKSDDLSTTSSLRADFRFKAEGDFFILLLTNKEVGISAIALYALFRKISKIKFIGVLAELQNIIFSQHNFGQIVEPIYEAAKPQTKIGKTVSRALATIQNKLQLSETSKETQKIFQTWFSFLVKKLENDPTYEQFLQECGKVFENQKENLSTSRPTSPISAPKLSVHPPTSPAARAQTRSSSSQEPENTNEVRGGNV